MRTPPPDTLVALLELDHEEVRRRFDELDEAGVDLHPELFWKLTDQLVRHEVAEEIVVYPAMMSVPGGDVVARPRLAEQKEAESRLAFMETLDPQSDEFTLELKRLQSEVIEHATREEVQAFAFLDASCPSATLVLLGKRYEAAKLAIPRHPHPHDIDDPTGARLALSIMDFYDRVRDAARGM
jgi:hypothetical protein